MKNTFFNDDGTCNKAGDEIFTELERILDPICEKWIKKNYNVREIRDIINTVSQRTVFLELVHNCKDWYEKRKRKNIQLNLQFV